MQGLQLLKLTSRSQQPFIHCSMGSAPVGVQCSLTFSLCDFPDYFWTASGILGFARVGVHRLSLCLLCFGLFTFTLRHLPLNFIRVSSLRQMYLHQSVDPSPTLLVGEFPGLGLALVPDAVFPEALVDNIFTCMWLRRKVYS